MPSRGRGLLSIPDNPEAVLTAIKPALLLRLYVALMEDQTGKPDTVRREFKEEFVAGSDFLRFYAN